MILFTHETEGWNPLAITSMQEAEKLEALPGSEMDWQKRQRARMEEHYKNLPHIKIGYYG